MAPSVVHRATMGRIGAPVTQASMIGPRRKTIRRPRQSTGSVLTPPGPSIAAMTGFRREPSRPPASARGRAIANHRAACRAARTPNDPSDAAQRRRRNAPRRGTRRARAAAELCEGRRKQRGLVGDEPRQRLNAPSVHERKRGAIPEPQDRALPCDLPWPDREAASTNSFATVRRSGSCSPERRAPRVRRHPDRESPTRDCASATGPSPRSYHVRQRCRHTEPASNHRSSLVATSGLTALTSRVLSAAARTAYSIRRPIVTGPIKQRCR